ncbi:unnamed protein product [Ranitomeya imitator]|uniref:Uncharacterized protein n=1 Tax=Ranitomeya imitator TaxID=111125 RepID=A0ABN9LX36_9NEOB|nr:unnamed protein product [Ranitomeya imitator]
MRVANEMRSSKEVRVSRSANSSLIRGKRPRQKAPTKASLFHPNSDERAPSPHITTRGSVPAHYHTRLRPHTLPHEAPSPHITTRGSILTHYHTRLRPHTLPHEAPSLHINTQGSIPPQYHTRPRPHTLPHEAASRKDL